MNTISQIHDEAMARLQLAKQVLRKGQPGAYKTILAEALDLEKKAAYALLDDFDCEPTRSVLFRSAAAIAFNAENYADAVMLATQGLNGHPFDEIKNELEDLLLQAKSQATAHLSVLNDDGDDYNQKPNSIIISTAETVKHSLYDSAEEPGAYEITEQRETISGFWAKTKAAYTKNAAQWIFDVFFGKERINQQIKIFLSWKLPLLNAAIGKEDTRWIWYPREFFETMYETITFLEGDGIRVYFGQFEDDHAEYASQTCLTWVPTRPNEYSGLQFSEDIIIEDEQETVDVPFLNRYYVKKEITNKRILNYRNKLRSLYSEPADNETLSIWYSREYVKNMITAMDYFDASGIRVYFGFNMVTDMDEVRESSVQNQTCLLFVLTRQSNHAAIHQNIVIEEDDYYPATLEEIDSLYPATEFQSVDYPVRYEPPYTTSGSRFPY